MSLVERALKKLQETRPTPPASGPAAGSPAAPLAPAAPAAGDAAPPRAADIRRSSKVATLDREALRAAELLPAPAEERRLAHQYRQIKRPLIANAFGRGVKALPKGRAILVASALPGDGKTFTAINLSLSMANEKDISVLLVDADVAKVHLSRMLGVGGEPGLLDVLTDDQLDVESVILRTDVPGLEVLPAGRASDNATELLASSRMEAIVAQLTARDPNRIVLFDSPPLLLTSESRVLCAVSGQVVLVVSASSTPQQAVFDAIAHIGEDRYIGLVLNQCAQEGNDGYYQYYGREEAGTAPP
jgi:exopolysaccharide/PEP-CTERM locus tyrosine autokinase